MSPTRSDRTWPPPGDPRRPPGARRPTATAPPVGEPAWGAELPVPVRVAITAAALPYDAAVATLGILRNTEALLGEMVWHLRALRPAVDAASQAYADGHFDPVFKTFDQIQQGTSAIGVIFAPISAVRQVVAPGPSRREIPAPAPVPPRSAPPRAPAPPVPAPPSLVGWLGGLGGQVLGQAAALSGALGPSGGGRRPRPDEVVLTAPDHGYDPVHRDGGYRDDGYRDDGYGDDAYRDDIDRGYRQRYGPGSVVVDDGADHGGDDGSVPPARPGRPGLPSLPLGRVAPLVPGPFRRLLGG